MLHRAGGAIVMSLCSEEDVAHNTPQLPSRGERTDIYHGYMGVKRRFGVLFFDNGFIYILQNKQKEGVISK